MADGSLQAPLEAQGEARLSDRLTGERLMARCRCGREAEVDPGPWLAQGLAAARLSHLETRLRCLCGARRVPLEQRDWAPAQTDFEMTGLKARGFEIWTFR